MAEEHLISIESYNNSQPIGYAKEIIYSNYYNIPLLMSGYCYTSTSGQLKISKNDKMSKDFRFRGSDSSISLSLSHYMLDVFRFKTTKIKDTDMSNVFWYFRAPAMIKSKNGTYNSFVVNQDSPRNNSVIYITLDSIKPLLLDYMTKKYSYGHPLMSTLLQNRGCLSELIPYLKRSTEIQDKIYNIIKKATKIPFAKEWLPYVLDHTRAIEFNLSLALYSDWDDPSNMYAFTVSIHNPSLKSEISNALSQGLLKINNSNMVSSAFDNISTLTDYLKHFSGKLIDKTANYFNPIFDPNNESFTQKEKDYYDFAGYNSKLKFFDAQKNVVGAVSRSLKKNKAALIVGEMGCGIKFV